MADAGLSAFVKRVSRREVAPRTDVLPVFAEARFPGNKIQIPETGALRWVCGFVDDDKCQSTCN